MKLLVVAALALGLVAAPAPAQAAEPTPTLVTKVKHRPVSRIAHDSPADPVQRHRADP